MERKIIGYKLIKPEYEKAAIVISGLPVSSGVYTKEYPILLVDQWTHSIERWKEAGVLDLWFEPVYEVEKLEIGGWYTCDDVPTSIICHQGNNMGYGIWKGKWESYSKMWLIGIGGSWRKLTNEEVEKRLTEYAKEHYPVCTVFKCVHIPQCVCKVTNNNFSVNFKGSPGVPEFNVTSLTNDGRHWGQDSHNFDRVIFKDGMWAEIIVQLVSLFTPEQEKEIGEFIMEHTELLLDAIRSAESEYRMKMAKEAEETLKQDADALFRILFIEYLKNPEEFKKNVLWFLK